MTRLKIRHGTIFWNTATPPTMGCEMKKSAQAMYARTRRVPNVTQVHSPALRLGNAFWNAAFTYLIWQYLVHRSFITPPYVVDCGCRFSLDCFMPGKEIKAKYTPPTPTRLNCRVVSALWTVGSRDPVHNVLCSGTVLLSYWGLWWQVTTSLTSLLKRLSISINIQVKSSQVK